MKAALLDVNVLIALLWPTHEHHEAAHLWLKARGRSRWATCPFTELAFARIVSNSAFSRDALSPADALVLLATNLAQPAHIFWPDDIPVVEGIGDAHERLQGHRQIMDRYLLAIASRHGGVLASFDSGIRQLLTKGAAGALEIVPTTSSS